MSQQTRRELYASWWYDVGRRTDGTRQALESLESDATDLDDYVETIGTLLSFGPNPRAWGDKAVVDDLEHDPYGHAISRCRIVLSGVIQNHSGSMSEDELKNLVAIEEFIRNRDNS